MDGVLKFENDRSVLLSGLVTVDGNGRHGAVVRRSRNSKYSFTPRPVPLDERAKYKFTPSEQVSYINLVKERPHSSNEKAKSLISRRSA